MPAYSSFVTTMTASTKKQRCAGLDSIVAMVKHLPKEQQLAVAATPELLAAVEAFLMGGDKADTALDLLDELTKLENGKITATTQKCAAAISGSPCFSVVKFMAATGNTVELKMKAWEVIERVSYMEKERRKAMFDSPGMVALFRLDWRARTTTSLIMPSSPPATCAAAPRSRPSCSTVTRSWSRTSSKRSAPAACA